MEDSTTLLKVRFEVVKVRKHFDDTGYTIAEAKFTRYRSSVPPPTPDLIITGHFPSIYEGDEFEGEGMWINHDIFGYQLKMEMATRIVPQSKKGIEEFIRRYVKGIGKKTAKKIVDTFGESTLTKIEESHKCLLTVGGISEARAMAIRDKLFKHKKFEEIAMFIMSNGGSYKTALRVYEEFGDSAIIKIRENPYALSTVKKIGFTIADDFAFRLGLPYNYPERIKEIILFFLEWRTHKQGDLYTPIKDLLDDLPMFSKKQGAYKLEEQDALSEPIIRKALSELKAQERIVVELNDDNEECVYLNRYHFIENRIVSLLKKLVEEPKHPICTHDQIVEFIAHFETSYEFNFAEKQKTAIYMALENGISILTGGPGTGKTQTINSIIQCVKYVNPLATIHLFAPTGKASKRMSELTGMEAMTIHRGIGLGFEDTEGEGKIVEGDLLVIDESSMMDAYVCYRLLSAIHENVRILIVGDYEQLPSVGPGLILRDLINSGKIPTTRLTEIFRQAQNSQIVMNSHRVIRGEYESLTFDQTKGDFYFIQKKGRLDAQKAIIQAAENLINNQGYKLDDIQILSPVKKGDLGVWVLNRLMQAKFNPPSPSKREVSIDEINVLREGDKVIHTVNNKELEVFNGEVGRIIRIYEDAEEGIQVEVEYDDAKVVTYDKLTLEEIELAFCLTIHKSQGSEYPIVIMPIHSSIQENMLTRNLIYTAWTRAKQKVVNVGVKTTLEKGIQNTDNTVRNSQVESKVRKQIHLKAA